MRSPRDEHGLSLIEVLVTTVVFSVGVLGVTGLNAISQRASFEAVQRSKEDEQGPWKDHLRRQGGGGRLR